MTDRTGYVALYRTLIDHPLMTQLPAAWLRIWIFILLQANWRPGKWWDGHQEIIIPAGSFVTSVDKLRRATRSGVQQVRSCLDYLKSTNAITVQTTSHCTILTVTNWATYQGFAEADNKPDNELNNKPVTKQQQAGNKPITTIEESNHLIIEEEKKKTDLDTSCDSRKNRAKSPEAVGRVLFDPDRQKLTKTLTGYFGETAPEKVISTIIARLGDCPIADFTRYLSAMPTAYRRGGANGPRSWAWFFSVATNFASEVKPKPQSIEQCRHGLLDGTCIQCNPRAEDEERMEAF